LLPVIPIVTAFVNGAANSISEITGIPFYQLLDDGNFSGMPGLFITTSAFKIKASVCFSSPVDTIICKNLFVLVFYFSKIRYKHIVSFF
jgi:hypothetical protein